MSKKQHNSSENEKRDQSQRLVIISGTNATTTSATLHKLSVQSSNEMSKTKNQNFHSPENEAEDQTQKENELKGKLNTTSNIFLHQLRVWLNLGTYFILLQHAHLRRQYECIIKNPLNLLNQIKVKLINSLAILYCRWLTVVSVANVIQIINIAKLFITFLPNLQNKLSLSVIPIRVARILGICPIRLIKLTTLQQQQQEKQIPKTENKEPLKTKENKNLHGTALVLRENTRRSNTKDIKLKYLKKLTENGLMSKTQQLDIFKIRSTKDALFSQRFPKSLIELETLNLKFYTIFRITRVTGIATQNIGYTSPKIVNALGTKIDSERKAFEFEFSTKFIKLKKFNMNGHSSVPLTHNRVMLRRRKLAKAMLFSAASIIRAKVCVLSTTNLEHRELFMFQWQHRRHAPAKLAVGTFLAEQHTSSNEKTFPSLAVKRIRLKTLASSKDSILTHKINQENKTEDQAKYKQFRATGAATAPTITITTTTQAHEVIQPASQHYDNNKYYLVCKQLLNEHPNAGRKYGQKQATTPSSTLHHQKESKCQYVLSPPCSWQLHGYPLVLQKRNFKYLTKLTEHTKTTVYGSKSNDNNKTDSSSGSYEKSNTNSTVLPHLNDNGCDNEGLQQDGCNVLPQRISQVSKSDTAATTTKTINSAAFYNTHSKTNKSMGSFKATAGTVHFHTPTNADAANIPSSWLQVSAALSNTLKPTMKTRQMPVPSSSSSSSSLSLSSSLTSVLPHFKHCHHSNFHLKLSNNTLISSSPRLAGLLSFFSSASASTSSSSSSPSCSRTPILLLFFLLLLSSMWHTSDAFHGSVKLSTNTIKTKYGLVRGIVVRSSPLVEAYLGIPYASPPVGSLRFMPPITPSTWKTVRNADRFSPVCPQTVPIPPNGPEALLEVPRARLAQLRRLLPLLSNQSEDCLYLNIYVPYENRRHRRFATNSGESSEQSLIPTILFIHGESYEWNSGNPYDGSELATHGNVIVVTINFRLGIFGFLKTGGKESAQGNFGLMDLVAGLHWLKENLPAFGGDPQAITLLGHGTGAALANILAVSPVASDLIQHVGLVSGSALSPWAIQKNPLFVKRRVAEQTGCHGDMLYDDLAPCLRTKSVAELLAVKIDHPRFLVGFAPFVDGTVISPNTDGIGKLSLPIGSAIVSTSGIEYANFPKRNLIFCLTSVESHLDLSAQDLEFGFNETRRDRILRTYVRNNFHYHLNEIFAVLKNEYTDWEKAIRSPLSSRDATLQFLSDGHTASSLIKLGYMHSLRGGKGYFLHFKHRTVEEEYPQRTGSVRGEDVPFWLGLPISPLFPHNYTTQERQISRLMLRYLANFAKTGNPNQSSFSPPLASTSKLMNTPSTSVASAALTAEVHVKHKRSSLQKTPSNSVNTSTPLTLSSSSSSASSSSSSSNANNSSGNTTTSSMEDVAAAAAREALNLAVLYNQRRTKRTYFKRHSRSNSDDQHNGNDSGSSEIANFLSTAGNLDGDEMHFWDAYDVVNQLYMELGTKAEIQSHYRGHKLSMWLNLIPQLHRHANMNDQSMRHHQFQDDLNNMNLYEGIVRPQIQTKPADDDETLLLPRGRPTPTPAPSPTSTLEANTTQKPIGATTECGVDGAMFVAEMTAVPPTDNRSFVESLEKEMATASTGLIATVAVGCFLLILNVLIFAGIYHQREKRARDAKTKEELQDHDNSKNSSILKLNALGSETGSYTGSGAGVSGKTTVVFGEYSCYDEKSVQTKDEKLMVDLPTSQMMDSNWAAACSTSTLDLLKTKHHLPLEPNYPITSNIVPITTDQPNEHLMAVSAMEMATYNPLPPMVSGTAGLILDPSIATSTGLQSRRGSFVGSTGQLNQYDFASVQSSDQMSFKDIENAVKVSMQRDDDITQDDDIPEPPPPPKSFQNMQLHQHHQQQQQQQVSTAQQQTQTTSTATSGSGGGILRQSGTTSGTQTGGGKKRVHIQEISV
uniref:Carboxylesterase type B domain-containing protein n=1 Tax=Musca domestica TaxID=7370 RepID=A0A1I8MBC6_MUSDO